MIDRVKIGVLGCSSFANRSIVPAIVERTDCFKLEGIASRDEAKAQESAARFGVKAFGGYESLLRHPGLQAVYIPLPNSLHFEWIGKALDAGLHVLVEKSMACTAADVKALNTMAQLKGLVLMENFQFRFHRQLAEVRSIVDGGHIGGLRCVRASFGFPPFPDAGNIRYQTELGGGALLDVGAYPIKISQILLGEKLSVTSAKTFVDPEKGVDIWGGGFLSQDDGPLFSEIAFGFDHHYQCGIDLWGSRGKLNANRLFTAPPGFEVELIVETKDGREVVKVPADNHFQQMLVHFHRLILNPELAADEYRQNVRQAELIEQFRILSNGK